jgi:small-conductance mechanosensitive channel
MEKIRKFTTIILWVLMVISLAFFVYMFVSIDSESNPGEKARNLISLNINWTIILFAIAAVVAIVFTIFQMFSEKAKALRTILMLVLFAAVIGVAYMLASSEIPQFFGVEKFVADGTLTTSISRWIGTGLYTTYILFGGAFLSIIGFSAISMFKRS